MLAQAFLEAKMIDNMDEDEEPFIFKRTSTISKQCRSNSEPSTKPTSQRKDGPSGKPAIPQNPASQKDINQTSHVRSPLSPTFASPSGTVSSQRKNGPPQKQVTAENSASQIDKTDHSSKTSYVKPCLFNSLASPLPSEVPPVKSPLSTSHKLSSSAEQSKHLVKENLIVTKEDTVSSNKVKPNAENSEDEKPLLFRLSKGKMIDGKEEKNPSIGTSEPNYYTGDSEDEKPLCARLSKEKMIIDKGKKTINKNDAEPNKDSDDSEDEKPIRYRLIAISSKGNNLDHANRGVSSSTLVSSSSQKSDIKKYFEESDDETPLSTSFSMKSDGMTSGVKPHDNGNNTPFSRLHHNGSTSKGELKKSPTLSNKRSLDKVNSSCQSSSKKLKLLDLSPSLKNKPLSKESGSEQYTQRVKSSTSGSRSSLGKLRVNKATSSFKKTAADVKRVETKWKYSESTKMSPKSDDGKKWTSLVHNGVIFPPLYKPHGVKMFYKGKPVDLTPEQEEVATMFAMMMETDYAQKDVFITNFMNDWRKMLGGSHIIQKFEDCDFRPIYEWHQREKERVKEKKKLMSPEEREALKKEKENLEDKYGWATFDGVKEKVGNFRVEPPGLFQGRGEHPKMGKIKRRIRPSDITINIGKEAPIPECPIAGESWKEVKHDNTVTWLACWSDPVNVKEIKYVSLGASSSPKGQSDREKYEKARTLKAYIQSIRESYTRDFVSKDNTKQQIAVATYLIDKLAIRAGNEKGDDKADTVGCCTLKVENVKLIPPNKLEFDFLGKDSIRYNNLVEVELAVYKAIAQFQKGKHEGDDLFDKLDTSKLNTHLKELMPGLTAKVFRTYNASITLDEMLARDTKGGDVAEKISVYNRANKEVAIICNHQRTISKSHVSQISKFDEKINELKGIMDELNTSLARAEKGKPPLKDKDGKQKKNLTPEALERKIAQTKAKIEKMETNKNTKEDLKTVALGTSKINYLDPRITVAWCKRHEVPIEKIFTKSLLKKFTWAMDCHPDFRF